jgi:hypothetical protein
MGVLKRAKLAAGLGAVTAALALGVALAETAGSPLPAAVQRLLDCRSAPDASRLACYDGAVAEFSRLVASGEIVVVDHERVAKVKRQAFGFSLPSLSLFERGDKPAELQQITGAVARAYQNGAGKWIVELQDGGVWEQTDDEKLLREPRKGSKVEIRKAAMGSFFMNIDGQRALRAKRIQ